MLPADRLSLVQEYYFSRKLKEVAQMNAEGKDIISLAIGSPDMPPSEQTIEKLCEVARQPNAHGYQPTMGTPELREAMAGFYKRWYNVDLDPKTEVLPLIGSKEGILHVTLAFVNPGDGVLVPNPGYPTYTSLSKILGANIINYNLREDNGWQPDFDQLEELVKSKPTASLPPTGGAGEGPGEGLQIKLLWTNFPNMPTGGRACRETYERLVRFAKEHDIVVVNDNPYSFILSDERLSILQVPGAKDCCIEFNSMSKSHNMPGWRVGLCATNPQFIQWILKVQSNIESGTFRGIQLAAAEAYKNDEAWHREFNINTYARRRAIAEEIMTTLSCSFDKNQVGMFLWGRIPDRYENAEQLTERILHEARVFITPGFIFGSNGERYVRISLCAKENKMREALQRIVQLIHNS
ncbi:MAG: aminotransferase class I/II-fold pyridoxal phosphate-dependent enzyme [Bacteroidaceae bacterium]|nr:aminotransferase class I/II-fold pyridoxal phosphate-dependent enzyme [Bacteroidaceae bacterium]